MGSSLLLHEYKDMLGRHLHLILIPHPPKLVQKGQITQNLPNLLYLQTKDMQAEVEIGQQRSARQFAADTLNPQRMTTLAFFRLVRKMIVVSRKLCLCPKTVILTVCMCGPNVQLNVIFTWIRNLCRIRLTPPSPRNYSELPFIVINVHYMEFHLRLFRQGCSPLPQLRVYPS